MMKQNLNHFKKSNHNMVQILHRGDSKSGHWFTVSTAGCNEGCVNWYDSQFNDLDMESKLQISTILKYDVETIKFNKHASAKSTGRNGLRPLCHCLLFWSKSVENGFQSGSNEKTLDRMY